jgi:hypothetical protein
VRLEGALLPGLLVLGWFFGDLWLPEGAPAWLPVVGLGVTLPLALSVQSLPVASTPARLIVASARRGLILLAAFILFTGLYATRVRAMIVAPAVGLAGALLAALALSLDGRVDSDREQPVWSDTLSLSLAAGLAMAEVVWPLLFWPAPALLGGAVLLAVFYGLTGVLGAAGRRSVQLEFTVISLLALAAIIGVVLRLR